MKLDQNVCINKIVDNEIGLCGGQNLEKSCVRARGYILCPLLMNLDQNVYLNEISDKFKVGSHGSNIRSQEQILEKLCIRLRGHIFGPILMKLGQNV